jgi:hypothetical protein
MKLNRTGVAVGLAVGMLAGGAGGVLAANGGGTATATTTPGTAPWLMGGMCGMSMGRGASSQATMMTAAAGYLGLSQTELDAKLRAGESLADLAKAQGKSITGLVDAIVGAVKTRLDANSALTADQKAALLAQVATHAEVMVNVRHAAGTAAGRGAGIGHGPMGHGPMGHGMMAGGMMGGTWR